MSGPYSPVKIMDILKIFVKSLKFNKDVDGPTIFFYFHGQVNLIEVQVFKDGWRAFSKDYVSFNFRTSNSYSKSDDPSECWRYIESCVKEKNNV